MTVIPFVRKVQDTIFLEERKRSGRLSDWNMFGEMTMLEANINDRSRQTECRDHPKSISLWERIRAIDELTI